MKKKNTKVQNIINTSGNNLHSKVITFLRDKGWKALISPYYNDNATGKAREIDIIAEKLFEINGFHGFLGYLNLRLILECKYIPSENEVVFWFDEKSFDQTRKFITKSSPLKLGENINEKHHYLDNNDVAKLFASGPKINFENEPFFKAINQVLNGFISFRSSASVNQQDERISRKIKYKVQYPIIVSNSFNNLHKVTLEGDKPKKIDDNFEIEVNYAYLNKGDFQINEYFLVSIVSLENLEVFIDNLEKKDVKIMLQKLAQ